MSDDQSTARARTDHPTAANLLEISPAEQGPQLGDQRALSQDPTGLPEEAADLPSIDDEPAAVLQVPERRRKPQLSPDDAALAWIVEARRGVARAFVKRWEGLPVRLLVVRNRLNKICAAAPLLHRDTDLETAGRELRHLLEQIILCTEERFRVGPDRSTEKWAVWLDGRKGSALDELRNFIARHEVEPVDGERVILPSRGQSIRAGPSSPVFLQ